MKNSRRPYIITLIMIVLCLAVKLFSINDLLVEGYYSKAFYQSLSGFFRKVFGFVPFSVGDLLYGLLFLFLLFLVIKFLYKLVRGRLRRLTASLFYQKANRFLQIILAIYFVFNILWGLNYNRVPVGEQLNYAVQDTTLADLKALNLWLVQKVNEEKELSLAQKFDIQDFDFLRRESAVAYQSLQKHSVISALGTLSLKPTLYSWVANSSGYTGYYNPFTGEAQVNEDNPFYELPFVSCHEIAHQLGYAKEMEANFVGFLACMQSDNHLFRYSAYKAMLSYSMGDLGPADFRFYIKIYKSLSPAVRADIRLSRRIRSRQSQLLQPFVMGIYEKYLWSNEQPSGLLSYNEVTSLMIGYFKINRYKSF